MLLVAQLLPARSNFVFHVYVDPIHGDNTLAFQQNPGNAASQPLRPHPDALGQTGITGWVQHAPFSFLTVNGSQSALAYVSSVVLGGAPLPKKIIFQHQSIQVTLDLEAVVIHCLPGLYGPALSNDYDSPSGLRFNGEAFPIQLPNGVCIQGTSALDTIFDGRSQPEAQPSPIFVFASSGVGSTTSHADCFIDSVTIRNAASNGTTRGSGAGIFIDGEASEAPTISNCFLLHNTVGIAMDCDPEGPGRHHPIIVNNTFAENIVGIWNGNKINLNAGNIGVSIPKLLNNVFDSGTLLAASCFEGVHENDLCVESRIVNSVKVPVEAYPNAWDGPLGAAPARANIPFSPANNFGAPAKRNEAVAYGPPSPYVPPAPPPQYPYINIRSFTNAGLSGIPRGRLFVTDTFNAAGIGVGGPHSPHDYRLTPVAGFSPLTAANHPNPLVNQGIYFSQNVTRITMAGPPGSNRDINRPPGLPNTIEEATLHAWDEDCEGFGNPRVYLRGAPLPQPGGKFGSDAIDLGADEMGRLIIGGYITSTRVFSRFVPAIPPNVSGISDHTRVYFLEAYTGTPNSYPRPAMNSILGQTFDWYVHKQSAVDGYTAGGINYNYTLGVPGSLRRASVTGQPAYHVPFMRNLECDFSPTLFVDIHPLWAIGFTLFDQRLTPDIYGSNPWCGTLTVPVLDNPSVYYNLPIPGVDPQYPPHSFYPFGLLVPRGFIGTSPNGAIINPPGTNAPAGGIFLSTFYTWSVFDLDPACSGATVAFSIDAFGLGDANGGCDIIPDTGWRGLRYNCQLAPIASGENIQTFLGRSGQVAPLAGKTPKVAWISLFKGMKEVSAVVEKAYLGWCNAWRRQ